MRPKDRQSVAESRVNGNPSRVNFDGPSSPGSGSVAAAWERMRLEHQERAANTALARANAALNREQLK
jgi:hypothetical protein